MATTTESILLSLEDTAANQLGVLLLDAKMHVGVNHVLELVASGSLTRLADLADNHCIAEVLLAVISDHTQGSL
mgnify:CR=1 FL=1